jgi:hypothetical protein
LVPITQGIPTTKYKITPIGIKNMKECLEQNTITLWKHKIYKTIEKPYSTNHTINEHHLTKKTA